MDFSNAFSAVWHARLMQILSDKLGLALWELIWFESYLEGRYVQVYVNGYRTPRIVMRAGVGQGSSLSPLLFLLAVAGIVPYLLDKFSLESLLIAIFADDCTFIYASDSWGDVLSTLYEVYCEVFKWCSTNGHKVNDDKTELMAHVTKDDVRSLYQEPMVFRPGCQFEFITEI